MQAVEKENNRKVLENVIVRLEKTLENQRSQLEDHSTNKYSLINDIDHKKSSLRRKLKTKNDIERVLLDVTEDLDNMKQKLKEEVRSKEQLEWMVDIELNELNRRLTTESNTREKLQANLKQALTIRQGILGDIKALRTLIQSNEPLKNLIEGFYPIHKIKNIHSNNNTNSSKPPKNTSGDLNNQLLFHQFIHFLQMQNIAPTENIDQTKLKNHKKETFDSTFNNISCDHLLNSHDNSDHDEHENGDHDIVDNSDNNNQKKNDKECDTITNTEDIDDGPEEKSQPGNNSGQTIKSDSDDTGKTMIPNDNYEIQEQSTQKNKEEKEEHLNDSIASGDGEEENELHQTPEEKEENKRIEMCTDQENEDDDSEDTKPDTDKKIYDKPTKENNKNIKLRGRRKSHSRIG